MSSNWSVASLTAAAKEAARDFRLDEKMSAISAAASAAADRAKDAAKDMRLQEKMGGLVTAAGLGSTFSIEGRQYKVVKLLGKGGFGNVYQARDEDGTDWAIKELVVPPDSAANVEQEVRLLRDLNGHPQIIRMQAASRAPAGVQHGGDRVLMVLEYCLENLSDLLWRAKEQQQRLPESFVLDTLMQVALGLEALHSRPSAVAHRDLKPENILVTTRRQFKLCDFGSTTTNFYCPTTEPQRFMAEDDIQKNTTLVYRAPEQVDLYQSFWITEKVDIWALGCVHYQLMFVDAPFCQKLGIINNSYFVPEIHPYSPECLGLLKFLLVTDPARRPDIYDVLERVAQLRGMASPVQRRPIARASVPAGWGGANSVTAAVAPAPARSNAPVTPSFAPSTAPAAPASLFEILEWSDGGSTAPSGSGAAFSQAPAPAPTSNNTFTQFHSPTPAAAPANAQFTQFHAPTPVAANNSEFADFGAFASAAPVGSPAPALPPARVVASAPPAPVASPSLFEMLDWQGGTGGGASGTAAVAQPAPAFGHTQAKPAAHFDDFDPRSGPGSHSAAPAPANMFDFSLAPAPAAPVSAPASSSTSFLFAPTPVAPTSSTAYPMGFAPSPTPAAPTTASSLGLFDMPVTPVAAQPNYGGSTMYGGGLYGGTNAPASSAPPSPYSIPTLTPTVYSAPATPAAAPSSAFDFSSLSQAALASSQQPRK